VVHKIHNKAITVNHISTVRRLTAVCVFSRITFFYKKQYTQIRSLDVALSRPSIYRAEYCDEHVCLSVCTHNSGMTCQNFTKFTLRVSFVGVAISCVLPVFWMTSRFPTMDPTAEWRCCKQPQCNVVCNLTPLPRGRPTSCILFQTTAGTKTRRVLRARGDRAKFASDTPCS